LIAFLLYLLQTYKISKKHESMYTAQIVLDKRHPRKDESYPAKLRVTINRYSRYFGLGFSFTEADFKLAFSPQAKGRFKTIANKLRAKEQSALTILDEMDDPDFDKFGLMFTQKAINSPGTVKQYYETYIGQLLAENRHGTAANYKYSLNSLASFTDIETLSFKDITVDFLKRYTAQMLDERKSINTIGIYLRPLRHLYKKAQAKNDAPKHYPFGADDKQFLIPTSEKHKRPLEREEIQLLAAYETQIQERRMYRDFFLLSYLLCGLNFADLLTIRWDQIEDQMLTVKRAKTQRTTKKSVLIHLFISEQARQIIDQYATSGGYVFDVISQEDNLATINKKVKYFTRNCNQTLKKIAREIGINPKISTIYARHSAASHGIEAGATIADVSAALGHTDIKTTSNYVSSLQSGREKLALSLQIRLPINPEMKPVSKS
jgi:integrase/recombinase XerD